MQFPSEWVFVLLPSLYSYQIVPYLLSRRDALQKLCHHFSDTLHHLGEQKESKGQRLGFQPATDITMLVTVHKANPSSDTKRSIHS